MEEMISLKKGNKIIKRAKANYEANIQHWKNRGFSILNEAPEKKIIEKAKNIVKLKPKKKKGKK